MREIKFRGKHIHAFIEPRNTGIWVYGYLCDDHYINSKELMGEMLVDKDTIGQYTGLKDKNGKEIYIGDILEYTFTDYKGKEFWKERYIVKENISGWEIRYIKKPRGHKSLSLVKNYIVIGNIYDNPELLEV